MKRPFGEGTVLSLRRLTCGVRGVLTNHDIAAVPCDAVLCATPIDLRRLLPIAVPVARRAYELREHLENALAAPVLAASR